MGAFVRCRKSEVLPSGFVKAVPSDSGAVATRFTSTEDFYDLAIFVGGAISFNEMVDVARGDERFQGFFKELDASRRFGFDFC